MIARLRFDSKKDTSLEDSINLLQKENRMGSYEVKKTEKAVEDKDYKEDL